ncbi:MAG: metallopeptidase [Oscillospiraceae bacterium]|nr:metallopeptidase [Oscillospiraceae bacterium]
MDQYRQVELLAQNILQLSSNLLHTRLRFLALALNELKPEPVRSCTLATDAETLFYGPYHILRRYRAGQDNVARDLLHLHLHCLLQHMFVGLVDPVLWDLACDMAAESILFDLSAVTPSPADGSRRAVLEELRGHVRYLTAEHIYRFLQEHPLPPIRIAELTQLFAVDDHRLWYVWEVKLTWSSKDGGPKSALAPGELRMGMGKGGSLERWKELGHQLEVDLNTFSKQQGDQAGSLTQSLAALNREKYDYTAFLKKFAVRGEVMKLNPDEFDYVYYTYGLRLYEKMPLIEPLEYREVKRIREFVIAIDTSGSVAGDLVQKFIQKTYNILKSTESFFSKINVHILQCDAQIQVDAKITSQEEFDAYLRTMEIRGLGGTDFRPVFSYVDHLIQSREFENLKGLIYFTDGYGTFPAQKPAYDAAFVFLEDDYNTPSVPPWAIKLVLQREEL